MPELPEVATIVGELDAVLRKAKILTIENPDGGKTHLRAEIRKVERVGKNMVLHLSGKKYIALHLRVTGQLIFSKDKKYTDKYKRFKIIFDKGVLVLSDRRKWATCKILSEEELKRLRLSLGVDALSDKLTLEKFTDLLRRSKTSIYSFLLNQKRISGLGNIYVNEVLYIAGIHPKTETSNIDKKHAQKLLKAIKRTLANAIEHKGTSFSDYKTASGIPGGYQKFLKVFRREGEKCRCGAYIKREKNSGRSMFYCPKEQEVL